MHTEVRLATEQDIQGVMALLKKYHVDSIAPEDKPDGFVTTNITAEQLRALITQEQGVTVAVQDGEVRGFAFAASWQFWSSWPFFAYMIEKLPEYTLQGHSLTTENSYQYGPICIDRALRGTGTFEEVFRYSLQSMSGRFPYMVTFINQINPRSYAAHTGKAGMATVGTFQYGGNNYYALACETPSGTAK